MEQIDRDVMRTHPDMHFFSGDNHEAELHRKVHTKHKHSSTMHASQATNSNAQSSWQGPNCSFAYLTTVPYQYWGLQ